MSDYKKKYAVGITFYGTPSHGGYKVSEKKNLTIPEYMRNENGWYEEDCEWAKVVVCFPDVFETERVEIAKDTLCNWFPDAYEKFYGVKIKEGKSHVRDEELFNKRHVNDYIVVSATTDENDPTMVKCFATKGGKRTNEAWREGKYFLVPKLAYKHRPRFGFVITENHKEI